MPRWRLYCPSGGIGLRARLKIVWPQGRVGSSPTLGTKEKIISLYYCTTKAITTFSSVR